MTDSNTPTLRELAGMVADEFEQYRQPDDFKEISVVIDSSSGERSTLIVHVDRENAVELADQVEGFLQENGARTTRETHSETDIRVLAIPTQ